MIYPNDLSRYIFPEVGSYSFSCYTNIQKLDDKKTN